MSYKKTTTGSSANFTNLMYFTLIGTANAPLSKGNNNAHLKNIQMQQDAARRNAKTSICNQQIHAEQAHQQHRIKRPGKR